MVSVNVHACEVANGLFHMAGIWAAFGIVSCLRLKKYRGLLWLLPSILVAAWLESAFNSSVIGQTMTPGYWSPLWQKHLLRDLIWWPILPTIFIGAHDAKPVMNGG